MGIMFMIFTILYLIYRLIVCHRCVF